MVLFGIVGVVGGVLSDPGGGDEVAGGEDLDVGYGEDAVVDVVGVDVAGDVFFADMVDVAVNGLVGDDCGKVSGYCGVECRHALQEIALSFQGSTVLGHTNGW